jgi:hypothetical protein
MDMKTWIGETEHAMRSTIDLVWAEHTAVAKAMGELARLEAETERGYRQSEAFMDDFDDEGLATAIHWDTYFGPDKERHRAAGTLGELKATQETRSASRAALAGTALQIAKQGISAVHSKLDTSPDGRTEGGVVLKNLIWQGRNQAMLWEEGNPHKAVEICFESLKVRDSVFAEYTTRNLAFELLELLGWKDYAAFEADMLSLA